MNKNLNLVEILKDCPKGTQFYSPVYGKIEFIGIDAIESKFNVDKIAIKWFKDENTSFLEYLRADGTFRGLGECIIFPSKEQRDWSKWQRPFVDGDFVVQGEYGQIFILKEIKDVNKSDYRGKCYIGYDYKNCEIYPKGDWWFDKHATEEEKQRLIDTLKENGYEWDAEKKELKKIEPKFDISTLQPFDKVIGRDGNSDIWEIDLFSHYDAKKADCKYRCLREHWIQCVPYNDETKHLIGTTDKAPEKYINW